MNLILALALLVPGLRAQDNPFKESEGTAAVGAKVVGAQPLGTPATAAYRAEFEEKARLKLLNAGPGADGKCSNLRAILTFIESHGAQQKTTAEQYAKAVDAVLADVELLFVRNSVRESWIGGGNALKINQSAKALAADPATRAIIAKGCKCQVGADPKKPMVIIFNNTGDESGYETNPVAKLNTTAPHELLHLILPRLGVTSVAEHHGLTDYLGWGGGVKGNFLPYKPGAACKGPA